MMQSRRSENAMLATVSILRRLLRKADLATKCERVMATEIFYTATSSCCRDGLPRITLRSETRQAASLREIICPAGRARRPSRHRLTHHGSRRFLLGSRESFAQLPPKNLA